MGKRLTKEVATPTDIGTANVEGTGLGRVRDDHEHDHVAGLGFDLHHDHYARTLKPKFTQFGTTTTVQDVVKLCPLEIPFTVTIDRIGVIWDTPVAGNFRLAIYEDNGDTPAGGALSVESASVAKAGINQAQELTVANTQLTLGLYWLAYNSDEAASVYIRVQPFEGLVGGTLITYQYALAYGAFTDPCPAVASIVSIPFMYVRVASIP